MRSLELAGTAGVGVIVVIASIFVWESVKSGLPAIADGELPLWGLKVGLGYCFPSHLMLATNKMEHLNKWRCGALSGDIRPS